jgi:hypothetical protein
MSISELYAAEVLKQVSRYATWLPNGPLEIGNFGPVKGALFESFGKIDDIETITGPSGSTIDFTIHASRSMNTSQQAAADAGVTSGKVLLEIAFEKEAGVSFSSTDITVERVKDFFALGNRLIALIDAGKFNKDHSIVVEVVHAGKSTIICSERSNAEIKFEVDAKTPINPTVMANLDSKTSLKAETGVGFKAISAGPLQPLFGLARIKSSLWNDPKIVTREGLVPDKHFQNLTLTETSSLELTMVSPTK